MPKSNKQQTVTSTESALLLNLNKEQVVAVTHKTGPLLIIAGAGTGKTTVVTRRISWLVEQKIAQPNEILALTFTEKAAAEMLDRVDQLMPLGYGEIDISTFHSFAQKILTDHALDIGLPGDFKVLTDTNAWLMIKKHFHEFELKYYKPLGNPNKFIHALLKHFGKAKGEGISPEQYLNHANSLRLDQDLAEKAPKKKLDGEQIEPQDDPQRILEVANAFHKYQKLLLDKGYLDFGDLINYTIKLFKERPNILSFYQKKYKYILVDEFQDTDLAQYELIRMLATPENNIAVVGDDDQSIYKFRGASISNILKFKEDYPDSKQVALTDNYRSVQPILNLAYDFIQLNNPERLETKLKISKKLKSFNDKAGEIGTIHTKTVYGEAEAVTDKILELVDSDKFTYSDFAILVRANDHAEPFISELNKRGVPFMYVANKGLYKKPFILDLLAYLKLLDNYHESENLFRVLNISAFKITDRDLIGLSQTAKRKAYSLYEVLRELPGILKVTDESYAKITKLLRLLEKHTTIARITPISELIVKIIEDLDFKKDLLQETLSAQENRSLLEKFYKKSLDFENDNDDKTLKQFLNLLKLEEEAGETGELGFDPNQGPESVKILTVHSAKGLEFNVVFVVNLVDQRFPSRERKEQIEIPQELVKEILSEGDVHLMEERRLFYVAMTRAKRFLFLTWANDYGGSTLKKRSKFLIDTKLIDKSKQEPTGEVFLDKQKPLPLPQTEFTFPIPEAFDFSQLSTFLKCPLEYKIKYIYHLPLPGAAPFSFGQSIHAALKKFMQSVVQMNKTKQQDLFDTKTDKFLVPPKDLLLKFYQESWIDDWYPDKINKETYRSAGSKMLSEFHEAFSKDPKMPKYLEQPFKFQVGKHKFKGRIDRADQNDDGSIDILDYKTGEPRTKLEKVDKDQLLIYQLAAQESFKEKVSNLSYLYLKGGAASKLSFVGSQEELDELKQRMEERIDEIIETIKNNSFYENDLKKSHDCKYRDYFSA